MRKVTLAIAVISFMTSLMFSLGLTFSAAYFMGTTVDALDFQTRYGLLLSGNLICIGFLCLLVPLYRAVAMNEWRVDFKRKAEKFWKQQQDITIQEIQAFCNEKNIDPKVSQRALSNLAIESPLVH